MGTILLSLTSLYPNTDLDKHPRICVMFNNVSKIPHPKKVIPEYGSKNEKANPESEILTEVPWAEYIMIYRELLLDTLEKQYSGKISKEFLKERIEKLFPDENFYFY